MRCTWKTASSGEIKGSVLALQNLAVLGQGAAKRQGASARGQGENREELVSRNPGMAGGMNISPRDQHFHSLLKSPLHIEEPSSLVSSFKKYS